MKDEAEAPAESNEDKKSDVDAESPKQTTAIKKTDSQEPPAVEVTDKKTTPARDLAALRDKIKVKLRKFKRI